MKSLDFNYAFETTRCKKIIFPKILSKELLYFVGIIVGDGSLPIKFDKRGYRKYDIIIEKANKDFVLNEIKPLAEKLFGRKWSLLKIARNGRKIKYSLYLNSKPLYIYLTKVFDIPNGRKASKVRMPRIIRKIPYHKRLPFIAGVMDTDWEKSSGDRFGSHSASFFLLKDINDTLGVLLNERWKIKKYVQKGKYVSYQLIVQKSKKEKLFKLLKTYFPLRNQKRINTLMPSECCRGS